MKVKNIFKKNQIIITALAIMIVIAGYLSLTNDDAPEDPLALQTVNPDEEEYDVFSGLEGMDLANDANKTDSVNKEDTTGKDDATGKDDTTDKTTAEDNDETVPVKTSDDGKNELGELTDDEILANAKDVTDNGELNLEDGVPGEAVLASALDSGYFFDSKLKREQVRAKNKATFKEIMESPEASEEAKQKATDALMTLTAIEEKESTTEMLLEARGFDGAIVRITDGKAEVVVNSANLTDQQRAIIESVVKEKADISVENISIVPVIVEE
jgi:stage III sporulation protein AH